MEKLVQIGENPTKNLVVENSPEIRNHFPFPSIRPAQDEALSAVVSTQKENKKFVIIEAPTGVGKSGIAIAAASWCKTLPVQNPYGSGAYILSPQKTLTAQYMKDFQNQGLLELKGKSNYWCHEHSTDCDTAAVINNCGHGGDDREVCEACPYKQAKQAFMANPFGVTNFAYYLNETQYAGQLTPREYLVLDEAHNTEGQILGFTDTEITTRRCEEVGSGPAPVINPGQNDRTRVWLDKTFVPAIQTYMRSLEDAIEQARFDHDREEQVKYSKKLDNIDKYLCRLNRFINSNDPNNWLCWTDKDTNTLIIKPLTATLFADEVLFRKGRNIIMMSATILDANTFMRNLGIAKENATVLKMDSEFPLENRPIFFRPVGSMSHKTIEETLPKMAAMVERLLVKYATKKGIVHTHSYRINKYLVEYLSARGHGVRIITHTNIPGDRDRAVAAHLNSPEPTVLFSPSMTEGLDLKEDLSRFQIITKVPYPYLDPYVKARLQRDPAWYEWLTALTLVQATGRSIRSKDDKAHTFILDSAFEWFLSKNQSVLPRWWTDSIIF
jgi:ATP-dependent DNA helicase DinG